MHCTVEDATCVVSEDGLQFHRFAAGSRKYVQYETHYAIHLIHSSGTCLKRGTNGSDLRNGPSEESLPDVRMLTFLLDLAVQ